MTQPISRCDENSTPSRGFGHLCDTCDQKKDCGWLRENGPRAVACEEFVLAVEAPQPSAHAPDGPSQPTSQSPLLGLCQNCQEAETCRFPKSAGGVWHCEEYR